jgi:NADH-quinone oxidoreductase subunit A
MDDVAQTTEFGKIFLYSITGVLLVLFTLTIGRLVSPKKPTKEKLSTYECGEEPVGSAWIQFNPRFYVIALVFLLFDVEMVFIFPWATVFGQAGLVAADPRWGWFTLVEMLIFVGILLIGLLYAWKKGDLEWIKPQPRIPAVQVAIPASAYRKLNAEVHRVKPVRAEEPVQTDSPVTTAVKPDIPPAKPAFTPRFRKPGGAS